VPLSQTPELKRYTNIETEQKKLWQAASFHAKIICGGVDTHDNYSLCPGQHTPLDQKEGSDMTHPFFVPRDKNF